MNTWGKFKYAWETTFTESKDSWSTVDNKQNKWLMNTLMNSSVDASGRLVALGSCRLVRKLLMTDHIYYLISDIRTNKEKQRRTTSKGWSLLLSLVFNDCLSISFRRGRFLHHPAGDCHREKLQASQHCGVLWQLHTVRRLPVFWPFPKRRSETSKL